MLGFLKKAGIKENTITTIEKIYGEANCFNLNSHESEIIKIIEYFKEIGIRNIDILLVEKMYRSGEWCICFNFCSSDVDMIKINLFSFRANLIDNLEDNLDRIGRLLLDEIFGRILSVTSSYSP